MAERRPTLADRFMFWRYGESLRERDRLLHPTAIKQMQKATREARRFVFNEEAARRVAHVVKTVPDLLVRECQFARAPFDITWIEFPSYAYWTTLREDNPDLYDEQGEWGNIDTSDHTVAFLIDHNRINTISCGTVAEPDGTPLVSPIQYRLNTEWPVEDQLDFSSRIGGSRMLLDMFFWGSTYTRLTQDERRMLRNYNVAEPVPLNPYNRLTARLDKEEYGLSSVARGSVGELRTVIALLLMLNRPSLTMYREVPQSGRGRYRSRKIEYMQHTVVSVALDPVPTLRLIGTSAGEDVIKRRHEVRGHYCHDKTARDYARIAGCLHDYVATYEDWTPVGDNYPLDQVHHWRCSVCEGKRWWRTAHERGTAEAGFVAHDGYEITDTVRD